MKERGIALVVVTMAMALLGGVAAALALTTASEVQIAAHFRTSQQALYAADAAAEWALADLSAAVDWAVVGRGDEPSTFVDGPPRGTRTLEDGTIVDLGKVVARHAGWHLHAYGHLSALGPPSDRPSPFYLVVFVAPAETGPDWLKVRAEAFGPRGSRRAIELMLSRLGGEGRLESWSEVQ